MSIDEYLEKRKRKQVEEATLLVKKYYSKYHKYPPKHLLREFFWIFEPRNQNLQEHAFNEVLRLGGNETFSRQKFLETKPLFDSYEMFLNSVKNGENDYETENKMD